MKDKYLDKAINWAKKKGFTKLKANLTDYETPRSFSQSNSEEVITPDVTGVKRGKKSFIEIALKDENKQAIISKWKLFSMLAERQGGILYLLTIRGHKSFAETIIKNHNLKNTMVVSI